MRKLNGGDVMAAVRAIEGSGLKEKIRPTLLMAANGKADVNNIGVEAIMTAVFAMAESEDAIWKVLSGPFETTPEKVAKLELVDLMGGLQWIYEEGGLTDFFRCCSALMSSK